MGLLDELKKLTKPYDDEDYLEEDLAEPVRVAAQDNRSYASYAEAPRPAEPAQSPRRPYVFSQQPRQAAQPQPGYAPNPGYDPAYAQSGYQGYAQQQPYATRGYTQTRQPTGYAQPQQSYAQSPQPGYGQGAQTGFAPQAKLLLVRPDRFEVAADIADRIAERNAIVLNLEETQKDIARRMLDFLSGVTYALGGKIKKVSGNTYVITPAGMDFMGDGLEEMETRESYF